MGLIPAYNTNGFYCHTLEEATRIVADLDYRGIALTPDVHHLDPFRAGDEEVRAYRALLKELNLVAVIETGARFLLDPRRKHHPTFFTPHEAGKRVDFLMRCMDLAVKLGAGIVSFHSGINDGGFDRERAMELLGRIVETCLAAADYRGIRLALEPEPGMFIESMADFAELNGRLGRGDLYMTLDVGHMHLIEDRPTGELIRAFKDKIINVHLDDVRGGRHEHLPPGEGEIDFDPLFAALSALDGDLFLSVELSRHGHDAVREAEKAMRFLRSRCSL